MSGRTKLNYREELPTKNESPLPQLKRTTRTTRIYDDTLMDLMKAIKEGKIRFDNGVEVTRVAEALDIAVVKLLGLHRVTLSQQQSIRDYEFDTVEQLDLYDKTLMLIPKSMRTLDVKKVLRQMIRENKVAEFLEQQGISAKLEEIGAAIKAPEDF